MEHKLLINQTQLRKGGKQLSWLALAGQICLLAAIVGTPYILWKIAEPTQTYAGFGHFYRTIIFSASGPEHVHWLIELVCYLLLLESVRGWGKQLSSHDPTGRTMLSSLARLKWAVVLLACVSAFSFSVEPSGYWPRDLASTTPEEFSLTSRMTWEFSIWPLFAGAVVVICIRIAEGIAATAEILRAENSEFV